METITTDELRQALTDLRRKMFVLSHTEECLDDEESNCDCGLTEAREALNDLIDRLTPTP